jgi:hypothetical protein
VTRQPSVQITWRPTSAALADIRSQRTMPSACGGALQASSAERPEPASVPVSLRPPGCSPTTDLARFGSAIPRSRADKPVRHQAAPPSCPRQIAGHLGNFPVRNVRRTNRTSARLTGWIPVLAGLCLGVCDRGVGGERLPDGQLIRAGSQHPTSRRYGLRLRQTHLLRPCEVRVLVVSTPMEILLPAAMSAAASARCHAEAGLRGSRRARRRPGRAAPAAATSQQANRRTGAHVGDHAAAVDQRAMIDK